MEAKTLDRMQADIKSVKDSGEFEAVLSAPTLDRDGEVVDARAFEPLPDHIPIDIDHGMSVTSTVGSGTPFYDGDILKFTGTFASTPLGQEVRTLVAEKHVRKMSVAFMSAQRAEDEEGTTHIVKAELLNAAIVAIPSNREADILAAKSLEVKATKAAALQHIHDMSVASGAECTAAEPPKTDPEKSTTEDPEEKAAAPAAAEPPAEPDVTQADATRALIELAAANAALAP